MEVLEGKTKEFIKLAKSDGSGAGYGSGAGNGYGYGDGYGYGSGDGDGYGDGYGIKQLDNKKIHTIDGIPTIITVIKKNIAKGFIFNDDLTLQKCYVAKDNYFSHGKTVKEALDQAEKKAFANMDVKERIIEFTKTFKSDKKYKGKKYFAWHNRLTGSCHVGRESFVKNKGLDLERYYTVQEFIKLTENDYGSNVISQLKEKYKK